MPHLPSLPYTKVIDFLESMGYAEVRQRGSHIRLSHPDKNSVTVPKHKPVSRGVLRKILRDTNETPDSLEDFLNS